jgi:ParB/RepB/Spo0J family partition protein
VALVVERTKDGERRRTGTGDGTKRPVLRDVPVDGIRPEEGLGRKRDRDGHRELCRSIEQFGVLTPITVRAAPDKSGEFLLVKGQGRTLACRLLGIEKIPAIIVDDQFAETEKVQQFLVENVARLRMRPIDRALLIAHARGEGEETASVAKRFGVSYATVRRLETQLEGATPSEVTAIRASDLNLARHAVIARHVNAGDRASVIKLVSDYPLRTTELEALLVALGWSKLSELGAKHRTARIRLLGWALATLSDLPKSNPKDRVRQLATLLPASFETPTVARASAR